MPARKDDAGVRGNRARGKGASRGVLCNHPNIRINIIPRLRHGGGHSAARAPLPDRPQRSGGSVLIGLPERPAPARLHLGDRRHTSDDIRPRSKRQPACQVALNQNHRGQRLPIVDPLEILRDVPLTRTWQGWLYLAVVMDLLSRKVIGWATSAPDPSGARPRCNHDGSTTSAPPDPF
jgi:transposase InsO family protein